MSEVQTLPPSPLRESDYEAIEAAVMETEKGRWFLFEYARRNRNADTREILSAISGLERLMKRERRPDIDRIRLDVGEMKDAIERTKLEIAQIKHDSAHGSHFDNASNELDAIVSQTEQATSDILAAAEKIQEIAWTLREAGVDEALCEQLETDTTTIYMACSFQDLTGQRTQKVVHVLRYLEHRINSMIEIWGMEDSEVRSASASAAAAGHAAPVLDTRPDAHLLNGPALEGDGMDQMDVDDLMFDMPGDAPEDAATAAEAEAEAASGDDAADPFATVDIEPAAVADDEAVGDAEAVADDDLEAATEWTGETAAEAEDAVDPAAPAVAAEPEADLPAVADETLAIDPASDEAPVPGPEAADVGSSVAPEAEADRSDPAADDDISADRVSEDAVLAKAAEAIDQAIETLRDLSAAPRRNLPAGMDDPFEQMSKQERQALLA